MLHPDFDRTAELARQRYEEMRHIASARGRRSAIQPARIDRLLAQVGRLLVIAGSRLEQRSLPQAQRLSLNL